MFVDCTVSDNNKFELHMSVQQEHQNSLLKDEMPQQRRTFLITYLQADLSIFKNCENFAAAVVEAFGSSNVVDWACCKEFHADGREHFHMSIKFK